VQTRQSDAFEMMKKSLQFCVVATLIVGCSDDSKMEVGLTAYDERVIEYFSEVALGFEFGGASEITRKWEDDMKIFVGGTKTAELMNELQSIVTEINGMATDGFSISIVTDSIQMNFYIFLGPADEYGKKYPSEAGLAVDNWGLFSVYWDASERIYKGNMYVDIDRANPAEEKHLLREELTQSLGLAKDSERYDDSIFQKNWTTTNDYADIDRDLIRLLYHPQMQVGLNRSSAEQTLTQIILNEK
jgi:hypothetical protein